MRYSADIMAQYESLFKEAHAELIKEAGVFDRMGRALARKISPFFRESEAARAEIAAAERAAETQAAKQQWREMQQPGWGEAATTTKAPTAAPRAMEEAAAVAEQAGMTTPQQTQLQAAATRQGVSPWQAAALGLGGLGLGAGGAYGYGRYRSAQEAAAAEEERKRTRNIAFGSGLAAGVVAPHVISGLGSVARGMAGTGLFPAFQQQGVY